jgi:hypothetical protein
MPCAPFPGVRRLESFRSERRGGVSECYVFVSIMGEGEFLHYYQMLVSFVSLFRQGQGKAKTKLELTESVLCIGW